MEVATKKEVKYDKLTIITEYNKYKGGVDRVDAALNNYLYSHKHKKWTDALGFAVWKFAVVNGWKLKRNTIQDKK